MIADGSGRAVAFALAPSPLGDPSAKQSVAEPPKGQAHELPHAVALLTRLPDVPRWVMADRGYSSHAFRDHVWSLGARPAVPPKRNEEQVACPDYIYANRNRVERLWGRLKGRAAKRTDRAVATRYEKTARSFTGVLSLAAIMDWPRR